MNGILDCSKELNKRLLQCEIYTNYLNAKHELERFPQYKSMVDNFRKKQVLFEAEKLNGKNVNAGEEFALSNEYADICLISVCNDFFLAEMELLNLIKAICSQICDGLFIDMAFMDTADS